MEHFSTTQEQLLNFHSRLNNMIRMNNHTDAEPEEEDYDFDYDPNEMYYALNGKN